MKRMGRIDYHSFANPIHLSIPLSCSSIIIIQGVRIGDEGIRRRWGDKNLNAEALEIYFRDLFGSVRFRIHYCSFSIHAALIEAGLFLNDHHAMKNIVF